MLNSKFSSVSSKIHNMVLSRKYQTVSRYQRNMSSHHHLGPNPPNGEIEHIYSLSEQLGTICLNGDYSDVTLLVEGQKFLAHKVILAARSDYFRALLYGGMRESQQSEIELKGTSLEAFKGLLQYIYTGHISLGKMKEEAILDVLALAHQYGFVELEDAVSDYLRQILNVRNSCLIFDAARLYQLQFLSTVCFSFMDRNAVEILQQEGFYSLSAQALKDLIGRDSFCAPEGEIFQAIAKWVQLNPEEDSEAALDTVRYPLMDISDLLSIVRPTGLVSADAILDAIQSRNKCKDTDLKYRGYMVPEENVAHPKHGTQVLIGEMRSALLDGDTTNYDMERGYTRHCITASGTDPGILIKLGMPCIINHLKMLLWDRDSRSYCYYIEVSMDENDWVRVVDHTQYYCRSWQFLYFYPRVVQFIRIVGTHNTVNKVFHVVSFEAMYSNTPFAIEKGIVAPIKNVATIELSATVIEGVSRSRNALLNGNTKDYDWDSGYTCHQLGSGSIVVQLGQPYMLESMRLLLWDCDPRSYSYYIQVSVNNIDWAVVCDKTREACKSWQIIRFKRQPVVFIRIVGMHNTANEVFHVVHYECPAQLPELNESVEVVASTSNTTTTNTATVAISNTNPEKDDDSNNPTQL